MGRRRKTGHHLPRRVYQHHGAFYFFPKAGGRVFLSRDYSEAMIKWATLIPRPANLNVMNDVFDRYARDVIPKKRERTQQDNIREIVPLRAFFGEMAPDDVEQRHIYDYMEHRGYTVRANREVALLSHTFTRAIEWGAAKFNPCKGVERTTETPDPTTVPPGVISAWRKHATDQLNAYVDLKLQTGLRKGDLLALRLPQMDLYGITVTMNKSRRRNSRTGKVSAGKTLFFPWTPDLVGAVHRLLVTPRLILNLIVTRDGLAFTEKGFNSAWQRSMQAAAAAGGQRFKEKDLRATVATHVDRQGGDAQNALGHDDRRTTDRHYIERDDVQRVEPVCNIIPQYPEKIPES